MKKQMETTVLKVTEKFDRELLYILSKEIKVLKISKDHFLAKMKGNSDNSLLLA